MATDRQSVVAPPDSSRDYPALGRLWQVPVFFLGLLAILGVWASQQFWNDPDVRLVKQALAEGRRVLENPRAPANTLPGMLADALDHVQRCPQRAGEVHFLLGWAYARLATQARDRNTDLWSLCRQQLELANHLGVPDGDISHLCYFLGKAWFQTGADAKLVIAALEASIDAAADDRGEGYAMLAQAYLRLPEPDLAHALEANRKQLDQPVADENLLAPARLLRGELLLRTHDREGARKALARIASTAPVSIVARARRLQARSYQEDEAWGDAARYWETILADERDKASDRLYMLFSLGWCYRNQHRFDDAARVWEQVAHAAGEEGQAACLRLAELCTETGKVLQALDLLEDALTGVKNPEQYRNNFVNLVQARGIVEAGCTLALKAGDFSYAERLAQFDLRLAVPPAGQVLLGQILETWSQAQREQAQKATADKAARHEEEARLHCQQAGKFFEAAAGMIADKTPKLDHLWRAARDYADGQDFEDAAAVLGRYLTLSPPPEKLAEAWYRLGQAMQALAEACQRLAHTMEGIEKTAQAVRSFNNCIGSPPSPFAFRARYELAMIAVQENATVKAEEFLQHNLKLMLKERDSEAHEKSLFALAEIQYKREDWATAAENWEKALAFYPNNANAASARFGLAECYTHLAEAQLKNPGPEPSAHHYRTQRHVLLDRAAANYQKVADDLEARPANRPLNDSEKLLLQESLFGIANCRFDQGMYDEAILLYQKLAQRYARQLEGLIALRGLYRSYLQLVPRDPEFAHWKENARATLHAAENLLRSLPDSAFQDRKQDALRRPAWEDWLKMETEEMKKNDPDGK